MAAAVGVVGGVVAFAMINSSDMEGAAAGKKVTKKKTEKNIFNEVAKELNPPVVEKEVVHTQVAAPKFENPSGKIDPSLVTDEPLLDKPDPALCLKNRIYNSISALNSTLVVKGEVRHFHQYIQLGTGPLCEAQVFPQGCESNERYVVHAPLSDSPIANGIALQLCQTLATAALETKTVFLFSEKYLQHDTMPADVNLVRSITVAPLRNMQAFQADIASDSIGNASRGISSAIGSAAAGIGQAFK